MNDDVIEWGQIADQVLALLWPLMQRMTGKVAPPPTTEERRELAKQMESGMPRVLHRVKQIQAETDHARQLVMAYELMNDILRQIGTSTSDDPLKELSVSLGRITRVPRILDLPTGVDCQSKHRGVRQAVQQLVRSGKGKGLKEFLGDPKGLDQLAGCYQRAAHDHELPQVFAQPPASADFHSATRIVDGLTAVLRDWERISCIGYALVRLTQHENVTWETVNSESLCSRVKAIRSQPGLRNLVGDQWVTVRNALSHRRVEFNPEGGTIVFRDEYRGLSKIVEWPLSEAVQNGLNIYLANRALLLTQCFMRYAEIRPLVRAVGELRRRGLDV